MLTTVSTRRPLRPLAFGVAVLLLAALLPLLTAQPAAAQVPAYEITLLHSNDGESALLPDAPVGGIARFATLVEDLRAEAEAGPTSGSVLVSSGDNYLAGPQLQASLDGFSDDGDYTNDGPFYDAVGLDAIGYDASAIGNHEFDFGPNVLRAFFDGFGTSSIRFVSANLDVSGEDALAALASPPPGEPGTIVTRTEAAAAGQRVGIVGATTPRLASISSPGGVTVSPDVTGAVQDEIDALTNDGVDVVFLISHLQSITEDQELIAELSDLDAAVAGGGDELLANGGDPLLSDIDAEYEEEVAGPYPLRQTDADGTEVPIVTTSGSYGYVGRLILSFDAAGAVVGIDDASGPVRNAVGADDERAPDPQVQASVVDPVQAYVDGLANEQIGFTEPKLDGVRENVRSGETNLGDLFADALVAAAEDGAPGVFGAQNPTVGLQNSGGIRADGPGPDESITVLDTFDIAPFSNFVSYATIDATKLKSLLERSVSAPTVADGPSDGGGGGANLAAQDPSGALQPEGRFGQWSGLEFTYDTSFPAQVVDENENVGAILEPGQRVRDVTLADGTAVVADGELVDGAPAVDIATNNFTLANGDAYPFNLADGEFANTDITYQQALQQFIEDTTPITDAAYPEGGLGRITRVEGASEDTVRRIAGEGRVETALEISRETYETGTAGAVVLTRPDIFPDALAGTPLAEQEDAPLLLTATEGLEDAVAAEIQRVLPETGTVYLLGNTVALSQDVEDAVTALGYQPVRYGGANRWATAVVIAQEGLDAAETNTVLLADGADFPDAVSAGAAAATIDAPVILTGPAPLPPETEAYLAGSDAQLFAIGGPAAAVVPQATPVVGASREETSVLVAQTFFDAPVAVGLATAADFPDALAGGAAVARAGGPLLLTFGDALSNSARDYVTATGSIDRALLFGGTDALSVGLEDEVRRLLDGR